MPLKTRTDPAVRQALNDLVLEVGKIDLILVHAETSMERRLTVVREAWGPSIEELAERLRVAKDVAVAYAAEHRDELMPGKRKSVQVICGKVSHRQQPPKLDLLAGWTWKRVLEQLGRRLTRFVHQAPEVDKESLLADAKAGDLDGATLAAVGLRLGGGEEKWDVTPNRDSVREELAKRG